MLLIVAVSLAGLFVLLGGVVWLVLTPPRLTPLVNRVATKYLNAEVHFDTVRLSLFENFPHVSLELKNGEVISGVFAGIPDSLRGYVPQRADSLLRFKEFAVTLNLPRLLAAQIAVRQLKLVDPDIYAFVSPAGNANWNIYTSADTTADTTATDLSTIFGIRVRELLLEGGRIRYESRPDRWMRRSIRCICGYGGTAANVMKSISEAKLRCSRRPFVTPAPCRCRFSGALHSIRKIRAELRLISWLSRWTISRQCSTAT